MRPVFSFRMALIATVAHALTALAPVAAETLSACGETPEAARAAFAKFISVEVKDVTTQAMARERGPNARPAWLQMLIGGGDTETVDTSTRLTVTSEQTTEVNLSGVRVEPTGQTPCPYRASIERAALLARTRTHLATIAGYQLERLPPPADRTARVQRLKDWIATINGVEPLVVFFQDTIAEDPIQRLTATKDRLVGELEQWINQGVRFIIAGDFDTLYVDEQPVATDTGAGTRQRLLLEPGEHSFRLTGSTFCDITDTFTVRANTAGESLDDKEIAPELEANAHPVITFKTNRPPREAITLEVNNAPRALGEPLAFPDDCNGTLTYTVTFPDPAGDKVKSGQIDLEPGLDKTVTARFYASDVIRQRVQHLRAGNSLRVQYLYLQPGGDFKGATGFGGVQLAYTRNHSFFRYGLALLGAEDSTNEPLDKTGESSVAWEANLQLRLQLTELGPHNEPFRFGPVAIVPNAGFDLGFGRHFLGANEAENFAATDEFTDKDNDLRDFLGDHGVARAVLGTDLVVHRHLGVVLEAGKGLSMSESWTGSLGIAVSF